MADSQRVNYSLATNGRELCKIIILQYVRGIRGYRRNGATGGMIRKWFSATPQEFVADCVADLINDGKMKIVQLPNKQYRYFDTWLYVEMRRGFIS